jgi:hypothetical protein
VYKNRYLNDPSLIDALNGIGPGGLFDFLTPEDRGGFKASARVKFAERMELFFGPNLLISVLCHRINDLARYVTGETQDQFTSIAYHLWVMDNRPVEAVAQLETGKFDPAVIRYLHLLDLMLDPVYLADWFVKRLVFRHRDNVAIRPLLYASFGRIALKECRRDLGWFENQDMDELDHVVDWIAAAVANGAPWLSNVDDQGRPKKIMKFGSLDAMRAEADKHMKRQFSNERQKMDKADEEDFVDEGGDFYIVQMKTPAALVNESNAMRHCAGHGAYNSRLSENGSLMLSLRDRDGWPHMTIEIVNGEVVQARGKANSHPKEVHAAAAHRLLDIWGVYGKSSAYLLNFMREKPQYEWA